jgi:hypothetical protein
MAELIYKFYQSRRTEAWYQLSEEQRREHTLKARQALEKTGGKSILACTPIWANEGLAVCGVEEFPNIEAVQRYAAMLQELEHFRYYEGTSTLATSRPVI